MNITDSTRVIRTLFSLEPKIKLQAILMFVYNFMLLNTLYLLKPVRDSLFLEEVGAQNLPFVFIFTAVAVIPISVIYSKISKRYSVGWIVSGITLFLSANLLLIWSVIDLDHAWLYYGFYIWVSIYSVLITSQFWLFANTVFNSVQSKKIFGFLSLGAIIGGFTGGELTAILINFIHLQPETLLLVAAIVITATTPLIWYILKLDRLNTDSRQQKSDISTRGDLASDNPIREILSHNHLLLIVALIAITVMVTTLIDYQFKTVAEQAFETEAALTSFMGKFYGRVSLAAFLIQFLFGSIFIKKYGVTGGLMLLPIALLISSGGMLIVPGLVAGSLSRGIDQSLKHSIDRTGRELLFVPLPPGLKKRIKVFIDLFVDHGAQGITGLLLLGLTFGLNLNVQEITVVVITLLMAWIAIAKMAGNSYVDVFRKTIRRKVHHDWDDQEKSASSIEKTSQKTVLELLESDHESDILWALDVLKKQNYQAQTVTLVQHLHHSSAKVRIALLELLRQRDISGLVDDVIDLAYDSDPDVRMEAIRYVYQFYEGDRSEKLKVALEHDDLRLRAVALALITEEGDTEELELITDRMLHEFLSSEGEGADELRRQTAKSVAKIYTPRHAHIIEKLLRDPNPSVVKQAIRSAGETGDRRFVHPLLLLIGNDIYRTTVEKSLQQYGSRIFGTMFDHMVDSYLPDNTRRYIPWLFSQTVTEDSWDILKMSLKFCSVSLRHGVIKALLQMRKKDPELRASDEVIARNVEIEISRYTKLLRALAMNREDKLPLSDRAGQILKYEIDQTFENIFRLLSLNNDMDDINNAYLAIVDSNPHLKADAIEFIENLTTWDIRKLLIPVLENYQTGTLPDEYFRDSPDTPMEVMAFLKEICHPELSRELSPNQPVNKVFGPANKEEYQKVNFQVHE